MDGGGDMAATGGTTVAGGVAAGSTGTGAGAGADAFAAIGKGFGAVARPTINPAAPLSNASIAAALSCAQIGKLNFCGACFNTVSLTAARTWLAVMVCVPSA